jgi:hypothetical protein
VPLWTPNKYGRGCAPGWPSVTDCIKKPPTDEWVKAVAAKKYLYTMGILIVLENGGMYELWNPVPAVVNTAEEVCMANVVIKELPVERTTGALTHVMHIEDEVADEQGRVFIALAYKNNTQAHGEKHYVYHARGSAAVIASLLDGSKRGGAREVVQEVCRYRRANGCMRNHPAVVTFFESKTSKKVRQDDADADSDADDSDADDDV